MTAILKADDFAKAVVAWQKAHGRHGLPWMVKDAYRRWVSEVMLQQTQVATVKAYYERFVATFPTVEALAAADAEDVMRLWAGLGYYSRARNLHACAKAVVAMGGFPRTAGELSELPGIGRSTAAAIASAAFDEVAPILDGNVKRVLTRVRADAAPLGTAASERGLWAAAEALVSREEPAVWNQGMMDLGSLVCTRTKPQCEACPVRAFCRACAEGRSTDFPVKKAKALRPERTADMTVFADEEGVWLVKRTGAGVWKGLWSLPEIRSDEGKPLGGFVHDFSHYRLRAEVRWVKDEPPALVKEVVLTVKTPWAAVAGEAIPTPVKKFLMNLDIV